MQNRRRFTQFINLKTFIAILFLAGGLSVELPAEEAGAVFPINGLASELDVTWGDPTLPGEIIENTVSFDPAALAFHEQPDEGLIPVLEGCGFMDVPGAPNLPVRAVTIPLRDGYRVTGVRVTSGSYQELDRNDSIAPALTLYPWKPGAKKPERIMDAAVYESNAFYPGRLFDLDQGHGANGSFAYLKIYPLQHAPGLGKTILARDLEIEVLQSPIANSNSRLQNSRMQNSRIQGKNISSSNILFSDVSVILCPEALLAPAQRLATLHQGWNRPTAVVTLESIRNSYDPADEPPQSGYKNSSLNYWDRIHDYDYDLALRIIAMLQDSGSHPNLESITLMGDGLLLPPSYYFYFSSGSATSSWLASDINYESPDYDLNPDYLLGRISVNDAAEADEYVDKIEDWLAVVDPSWFDKVTAGGGIPFDSPIYNGELIQAHYFNQGVYDGFAPTVQYFSEDTFSKQEGRKAFRDGGMGVHLHIGHGSGSAVFYENGGVGGTELLGYDQCSTVPLVVSVSCMNGAFDTDLLNIGFSRSFAESVIRSPSAGICYIGGSRNNSGLTNYHVENGRIVMDDQNYMIAMLGYAMKSYDAQTERLGELTFNGRMDYLANKGLGGHNLFTYLAFCLHGDPELPIPARPTGTTYTEPECQFVTPVELQGIRSVVHLTRMQTLDAHFDTTSPNVKVKIVHPCTLETGCVETHSSAGMVSVRPKKGSRWSVLRAAGDDGRECWHMMLTNLGSLGIDGQRMDWRKARLRPMAIDPPWDMTDGSYDLVCLYHKRQDGFDYIGFDIPFNVSKPSDYNLAMDTKINQGYTGTQGVDKDAGKNWVTFTPDHAPDKQIIIERKTNGTVKVFIYKWAYNGWTKEGAGTDIGMGVTVAYNKQHHFIELGIPEGLIGTPLSWYATLYSTTNYGSPAQDSTPSDPATYTEPQYGSSNANTLTQFVKLPRGQ